MQSHGIWALAEDPGPIGFYVQTNEFVGKLAHGRWLPMVRNCPPLQKLLRTGDRFSIGKAEIYFQHTFAYILAANESNTQTISLRYVFCDDVFVWTPGMLGEAHKRATQWWNRRILNASTAGDGPGPDEEKQPGSDMHRAFEGGDKQEWQLACPDAACRHLQVPTMDHLVWPSDERTKPHGQWNFSAVKKLTRFRCEQCKKEFAHTEDIWRRMIEGGCYKVTNPNAPSDRVSFRWNALTLRPSAVSWGDLAEEYIKAARALKAGHILPMREFQIKRMARSWDLKAVNPFANLPVIDLDITVAPDGRKIYWPLQEWLIMGVDVQIDHFWVLVMAFSARGDECALLGKKLYGWDDIAAVQEEYGVLAEDVCVDWSHRPQEVIRECARRGRWGKRIIQGKTREFFLGWRAYRGSDEFQFLYEDPFTKNKSPLPYKWPPARGNPVIGLQADNPLRKELAGRFCPIVTWSNPSIKDIVLARRDGLVKNVKVETTQGDWTKEYFRQQFSQRKEHHQPKFGPSRWVYKNFTDDHLLDARCMCTVRAIQRGLIVDVASVGEDSG